MATTNHDLAKSLQLLIPHTFNALQKLVVSMAKYNNNKGKRTFFGKDKELVAYKVFESTLRDTLLSMVLDDLITRDASPSDARKKLVEKLSQFSKAFPNWQDAYSFADDYFIRNPETAETVIGQLLF